MIEISARDSVIALLEQLKSDDDAAVLVAVRELNAKVSEMGVQWDELLVPDDDRPAEPVSYNTAGESSPQDVDVDSDAEDDAVSPEESSFDPVGEAAEDVARIETLKAMPGISDALRQELDDFLEDIKENEFTVSDRQYLQALQQRISKASRKGK